MSHHLVKIRYADRFVGADGKDCLRKEAPIRSFDDAVAMARKRFGEQWEKRAEIIEISESDWMSHIASCPRPMTPARKRFLERLHKERFPLKRWRWVEGDKVYLVYARAAQKAEKLLAEAGVTVNWRTFMRRAEAVAKFPFSTKNSDPGVWIQNGKGWKKIV